MGIFSPVTTYRRSFRSTDRPNEYDLRVYTGGLATNEDADPRVIEECDKFKTEQRYSTFAILKRSPRWFPHALITPFISSDGRQPQKSSNNRPSIE
jgi:hypothetical protein